MRVASSCLTVALLLTWNIIEQTAAAATVTSQSARIVGGAVADKTRYPYFTALFYVYVKEFMYFSCGGSLIRDNVVVSAAHCVIGITENPLLIVNFTTFQDIGSIQDGFVNSLKPQFVNVSRTVSHIVVHPLYDNETFANDIALLFLEEAVVDVIPISIQHKDDSYIEDNTLLKAIGAGLTANLGKAPTDLLEVNLPKINDDECSGLYNGLNSNLTLCAGFTGKEDKSICSGDSGGPLILLGSSPQNDILVGITSFAVGCNYLGYPPGFTRVSAYYDWITCVWNGGCNTSFTQSPTTPPFPTMSPFPTPTPISLPVSTLSLPGPNATVNVSVTTDYEPAELQIYYRDLCTSKVTNIVLGYEDLLDSYSEYEYSITLTAGLYEVVTMDYYGDGFVASHYGGVLFTSSNGEVLNEITSDEEFSYIKFLIAIGDSGCTPYHFTSSTINITVILFTDFFPEDTSISYVNMCTGVNTTILEAKTNDLDGLVEYSFPLWLLDGKYQFIINDIAVNEIDYHLGYWSVKAGDTTLYNNSYPWQLEDRSNIIIVGQGCETGSPSTSPSSTPWLIPTSAEPTFMPSVMETESFTTIVTQSPLESSTPSFTTIVTQSPLEGSTPSLPPTVTQSPLETSTPSLPPTVMPVMSSRSSSRLSWTWPPLFMSSIALVLFTYLVVS